MKFKGDEAAYAKIVGDRNLDNPTGHQFKEDANSLRNLLDEIGAVTDNIMERANTTPLDVRITNAAKGVTQLEVLVEHDEVKHAFDIIFEDRAYDKNFDPSGGSRVKQILSEKVLDVPYNAEKLSQVPDTFEHWVDPKNVDQYVQVPVSGKGAAR